MTDLDLINESKKGVTSCFEQLVTRYQLRLYSFLLARCHHQQDADDLLQETFIRAYKYIHSYNDKWAFSTWLYTIARRCLSQLNIPYHQPIDETLEPQSQSIECSELIDSNNLWKLIKKHLNKNCYDALWFYYMEDSSIKEISQILDKSESWVKTNLHRSKMKLSMITELRSHFEA